MSLIQTIKLCPECSGVGKKMCSTHDDCGIDYICSKCNGVGYVNDQIIELPERNGGEM